VIDLSAQDSTGLAAHTRRFLWATIGVIVPLAALLVLFPHHTAGYWMWGMGDARSAVLVGAVYAGATVYYLLAVLSDDWMEAQAGLEGIFTVSVMLLFAVILHWEIVRPWHLMTLIWMPAYYVPLFFVPYVFRLERGWARRSQSDRVVVSRGAAGWLAARGLAYASFAAAGVIFAEALTGVWPWTIDAVEVRMFLGQPATFALATLAVLRGNLLWRRHRLPVLYLGALGVVQLAGLLALRTPYRWASPMGVLLPLVFAEWIITSLMILIGQRRAAAVRSPRGVTPPAREAGGGPPGISLHSSAAQYGVMIVSAVYLAIGVLGFLPVAAINPPVGGATYLLRHIAVNGLHNVVHLAIGVTGLAAARRPEFARVWSITVGVILLALFLAGIVQAAVTGFPRDQSLLGLIALNSAGHVFHLSTGLTALIFGGGRWNSAGSKG
jgi:Domain of unknown function (DUF4383)